MHDAAPNQTPKLPRRRPGTEPLTPELRRRVEALFAQGGLALTAQRLRISSAAVARALAGSPVLPGTISRIEQSLDQLPPAAAPGV